MKPADRRELRRLASLGEDATEEEFGVLSHALIPLLDALDEAEKERDALRARLDRMCGALSKALEPCGE